MHNVPKSSIAVSRTESNARTLRHIADVLGVPVSSFGDLDADPRSVEGLTDPEEAAVLATVRSYLKRADLAARDRFVAVVQTLVKLPLA